MLIGIDEKTGLQAKSRKHPEIPARTGRDARRELEYVRHGTISIIATMNVSTGQVIAGPTGGAALTTGDASQRLRMKPSPGRGIAGQLKVREPMAEPPARIATAQRADASRADVLLASKLYVPRPRPGFVPRPRSWWLILAHAARPSSSRARWLVRRRSSGVPVQ